jgi:hypothetical protein
MWAKSGRGQVGVATPGCIIRGHARQAAQHVLPTPGERTVVMTSSDTRARVDNIIFNETLRRFTQDSPVSSDGRHGNPEMHTLERLEASRGASDQYQVHLTCRDGKEQLGERLDAFLDGRPAGRYRFRDNAARSLKVDLATVVEY